MGIRTGFLLLLTALLSNASCAKTFEGKFEETHHTEGKYVYLFGTPTDSAVEEWVGTEIVDSALVTNGKFSFDLGKQKKFNFYRLQRKSGFLDYFFYTGEDRTKVYSSDRHGILKDTMPTTKMDRLYKDYRTLYLRKNFNQNDKRELIDSLISDTDKELGLYMACFFSSTAPTLYKNTPMLKYPQMMEIYKHVPDELKSSNWYNVFGKYIAEAKEKYVEPEGYRINGYCNRVKNGKAVLALPRKGTHDRIEPVDTVDITNGHFTFEGKLDHPLYAMVKIVGTIGNVQVILDNSDIDLELYTGTMSFRYKDSWMVEKLFSHGYNTRIVGGAAQDEFNEFGGVSGKDPEEIREWIKSHSKSYAALDYISIKMIATGAIDLLQSYMNCFDSSMKETIAYKYILEKIQIRENTEVGVQAPSFTLPSIDGKKIKLKKYKGKIVLIDFWASWCGPCKEEMPHIRAIHEEFKDKDVVVISISSDRNLDDWKKAVKDMKMDWLQLSSKGSTVSKEYGVQGIPHVILIDEKGEIYANKLRGAAIRQNVVSLINKRK